MRDFFRNLNAKRKAWRVENPRAHDLTMAALAGMLVGALWLGIGLRVFAASFTVDCGADRVPTFTAGTNTVACAPTGTTPPAIPPITPPVGGGNFAGCPADTLKIDGQWGKTAITTSDFGGFGGNILSIRVAPPAAWVATSARTASWANFIAAPVEREYAVSTKACDFGDGVEGETNILRNGYGYAIHYFVTSPSFDVKYRSDKAAAAAVRFVPGNVYYINVRNRSPSSANTCSSGECTMRGGLPS